MKLNFSSEKIKQHTGRAFVYLPLILLRQFRSALLLLNTSTQRNSAEGTTKGGRRDGDGGGAAGGCSRRGGDVPVGAVRLHAWGLDGGGDVLPEAAGRPVRAPGHRLPPLDPALRLQYPLRRARRRQLQPHRRRRLLCRRSHQPLPLRRRAPIPGAGRGRCGRRSCHLGADAGAVQAHAWGALTQGGSPHRRRRRISAHFRHHHGCALDHRQGPPQPHHQDMDALHLHRMPCPLRRSLHRPFHEPSQCIWLGICQQSPQHVGAVLCVLDMPLYWCRPCCVDLQGIVPGTAT